MCIDKYRKDHVNILLFYAYTYLVQDSLCPIKGGPRFRVMHVSIHRASSCKPSDILDHSYYYH